MKNFIKSGALLLCMILGSASYAQDMRTYSTKPEIKVIKKFNNVTAEGKYLLSVRDSEKYDNGCAARFELMKARAQKICKKYLYDGVLTNNQGIPVTVSSPTPLAQSQLFVLDRQNNLLNAAALQNDVSPPTVTFGGTMKGIGTAMKGLLTLGASVPENEIFISITCYKIIAGQN